MSNDEPQPPPEPTPPGSSVPPEGSVPPESSVPPGPTPPEPTPPEPTPPAASMPDEPGTTTSPTTPTGPGEPGEPAAPGGYMQPTGVVPDSIGGVYYNMWLVILLMVVTCGIWGIFWTYRTSEDLKKYNGDGLGGVLGVVIYLLLSVVLMFTIPDEIRKMHERDGRESPVNALWGLWFLLPIIGNIVWYVKVQTSLNEFWLSKGARPE